jgi:hypothetical protein
VENNNEEENKSKEELEEKANKKEKNARCTANGIEPGTSGVEA